MRSMSVYTVDCKLTVTLAGLISLHLVIILEVEVVPMFETMRERQQKQKLATHHRSAGAAVTTIAVAGTKAIPSRNSSTPQQQQQQQQQQHQKQRPSNYFGAFDSGSCSSRRRRRQQLLLLPRNHRRQQQQRIKLLLRSVAGKMMTMMFLLMLSLSSSGTGQQQYTKFAVTALSSSSSSSSQKHNFSTLQRRAFFRSSASSASCAAAGLAQLLLPCAAPQPAGAAVTSPPVVDDDDGNAQRKKTTEPIAVRRGTDQFAQYEFLPPADVLGPTQKPVKTHLDEVNFTGSAGGLQFGITVDPVRIDSLAEFGTPEQVAAKVVLAEVNRDGVFNVQLMQDPVAGGTGSTNNNNANDYYQLNYKSSGKRGVKRFVAKFYICNRMLYALTAQCNEDSYDALRDTILHAVDSFRVVDAAAAVGTAW
jgi:PsbP